MKYVNRYVGVLIALVSFYYLFNFWNLISFDPGKGSGESVDMLSGFESLKQRIEYLQNLVESKEKDINSLKTAFSYNVKYYNELVEKQKAILTSLKNNTLNSYLSLINRSDTGLLATSGPVSNGQPPQTGTKTSQLMDVEFEPSIINNLPHLTSGLKNSVSMLQPKFSVTKNRRVDLVIGVPTIKREKTSYLIETLKSLIDSMNDVEKSQVLVVIIIAEIEDQVFIQDTVEQINKIYKYEVETGLFDIIVPPGEFYPDLSKIQSDKVFNDSLDRKKWRTKQNYDFSYLMLYSQRRGQYYLQLEDDVVSKANFVTTILSFIKKQSNKDWMVIEFSKLGFIGKLFKCEQLSLFVNFFLLFAHDKPIDWLYDLVLDIKICNPEKGQSHCLRSKDEFKLRFKPSLFQHVGTHSSLKGKTQKLKDKDFGKQMLIVAHNNPAASITTTLKTYMKNSLDSAYLGQNYFWAMSPAANDYILFEFKNPELIRKYYVKTGNPEHPDDRLYNATFEIKPSKSIDASKLPAGYTKTTDDFYIIDRFSERLGVVNGLIDADLTGAITKIRIRIPVARETWIIISEINFSTQITEQTKLPSSKMVSLIR